MSLASQGIKIGAHHPIPAGGDALEALNQWEQMVGRRCDIVVSYRKWGAPSGAFGANTKLSLQQASSQGRVPLVTWEPVDGMSKTGPYTLESIATGYHDEYIRGWANGLRDLGSVYLRPMHEMNGNWYPWSGDPDAYVRAWQWIHDRFREAGATNVKFVWCVNTSDQPKAGPRLEAYWPGSEYVDVLGIDGYNNYGGWRSFEQINRKPYDRVCALDPKLPVWICETASAEGNPAVWPGTNTYSKAEWIAQMFATTGMERVEALCWFDQHNPSSFDWRLDTTQRSLSQFRAEVLQAGGYVPAPGPYVPPVPDRVAATYLGPGTISVRWRQIPSFYRGVAIRVRHEDGYTMQTNVLKPAISSTVVGVPEGRNEVALASYTLVRTSAFSPAIPVQVEEPF